MVQEAHGDIPTAFSKWDAAAYLRDEQDMLGYLAACAREDTGDGSLIRAALGDIARSRGISQLAKDSGISRAGLYAALSGAGNPSFRTILKVSAALGLRVQFESLPGSGNPAPAPTPRR